MNKTFRRYLICLFFTLDLAVLVLFSELLRSAMMGFASTGYTIFNTLTFILMVFAVVPLSLLFLWFMNPLAVKKLLVTFGLNEKLLDKKRKTENRTQERAS